MASGRVIEFDEHVGLGRVQVDEGHAYVFHCVEIADGSRTIDVGTAVEFDLVIRLGRHEARALRPRPLSPRS